MTGRQEYDRNMTGRQDDRQRILGKYMIEDITIGKENNVLGTGCLTSKILVT
jgi:hypothetical protein